MTEEKRPEERAEEKTELSEEALKEASGGQKYLRPIVRRPGPTPIEPD